MFKKTMFSPGILLLLGIMAAPVMADPIIYQGGGPDKQFAYYADSTTASFAANNYYTDAAAQFSFTSAATVTDAHWWGVCDGVTCASTNFTLTIYQDNLGAIGSSVASINVGSNAGETAGSVISGGALDTLTEYSYSTSFAAVNLTAGTYWLGISRTGGTDGGSWLWETTAQAAAVASQSFGLPAASASGWNANASGGTGTTPYLAFKLTGTTSGGGGGGGNAPEPATFALMGLGLMGLGWTQRRRAA